ncbi:MAG: alpha-mannosidase [Lachnospiraceae bacterium]
MWFIDKRIQVICDELKRLTAVKTFALDPIHYKKGKYFYIEEVEAAKEPWKTFDQGKEKWYGPDSHYWFRTDYIVPQEMAGQALRLHLKTQIEEWDDAKNPQFLLFVNGRIVQGLDMNHRTVCLAQKAVPGQRMRFDIQAYTGTLHAEFEMIMNIRQVDLSIEKLYYDLIIPLQAFDRMEKDDKTRMDIETILNNAINRLDLRTPYSEDFYHSIADADAYLEKALYRDMTGYDEVIATCIGHTHIDVAWWWTVGQTREKVARSFATVLKLMDEYPNYKFMSSQPQLYVFLKERYPDLYERVKEKIKEGRWEAEGGMWLEADTNLTSGESLVRQFLHGKQFFKEEFGFDNKILWLPDVFGYSGALPQIMKRCGIDYFMTTKLAWNQTNKIPYDTFNWKGIDGSSVFTHLVTTLGVGQSSDNYFTTYNGILHPDAIMGGWERYQNKDINNDILICYGYGDGGGGPTREMLETSLRMEKGIKGIPKVRQEFAGIYFNELYERVKDHPRLPVWEGELYFEYHRGTYTSMARNKRDNRKSENMMMDLELFSVLAADQGLGYPYAELNRMWKVILLNQFHDILPGSSIHEVYEVTKKEYEQLKEEGAHLIEACMNSLITTGENVIIYNTLGFARDDVVRVPDSLNGSLKDQDGKLYPIQQSKNGTFVYVKGLPSKGYKTFEIVEGNIAVSPFHQEANRLETPFYSIVFDNQGMFTSIYDKRNKREVLQMGKRGNLFCMFEDKPIYYDNWDIDIYYTEKKWEADDLTFMKWTETGSVCTVLELERKISNSIIRQNIYFYADSARIDFVTYVDWKEHQHLLKVEFPVDIHTDEACFDIQFGNLTRKIHHNTSWDVARFESCGQKWMDLSEGHYGVSLLNDCKYGYSARDSVMSLTLIKSGIEPNPVTDQEEHYFTYSLYPHAGNLRDCDTIQEGYKLNFKPHTAISGAAPDEDSFVGTDDKNIMIETVKAAEDGNGVIIRLYECENARTDTRLFFGMGKVIKSIWECNLLEEAEDEITKFTVDSFEITVKPFEIKTYRVVFREL